MKIPHLYEINPFDNTEKVYESISGCTFKTLSEESPGLNELQNGGNIYIQNEELNRVR